MVFFLATSKNISDKSCSKKLDVWLCANLWKFSQTSYWGETIRIYFGFVFSVTSIWKLFLHTFWYTYTYLLLISKDQKSPSQPSLHFLNQNTNFVLIVFRVCIRIYNVILGFHVIIMQLASFYNDKIFHKIGFASLGPDCQLAIFSENW